MSTDHGVYPVWKAPAEDGGCLLWPDAGLIRAQTTENHHSLAAISAPVQNIPLHEVRRRLRQSAGIDDRALVIADGHQTELYHPGVWAKQALAAAAANKLGGQAVHIAVDTDQPKHLALRWPGGSEPITDDPNLTRAPWCGLLHSPSGAQLNHLRSCQAAENYLAHLSQAADHSAVLSQTITQANTAADEALGQKVRSIIVSRLLETEPYLLLAHHLLAQADKVAGQYNAALAAYRKRNKIRAAARPMPDLAAGGEECESPFWLDDLRTQTRRRATVSKAGGRWNLSAGAARFTCDESADGWEAAGRLKAFLADHQLRLAPRALTLTLFLRLFLADQFIHGIGGGQYDQITNEWIRALFGVAAPHFCVTTATLYHPSAAGRTRVCLPCLAHEGHRIKHAALGDIKLEMARQMETLPRRSVERQVLFGRMHTQLSGAMINDPALKQWEQRFAEAKSQDFRDQIIFDRELFYAIQPRQRLQLLTAWYQAEFA